MLIRLRPLIVEGFLNTEGAEYAEKKDPDTLGRRVGHPWKNFAAGQVPE